MKSSEQIRDMLIQRLGHMLRRPGMWVGCDYDLEIQLRGIITDLWFIDEVDEIKNDHDIINKLIAEGLYYPSNVANGVGNVFRNIAPDIGRYKEYICSIYARIAFLEGYLEIKALLLPDEFEALKARIVKGDFSRGYNQKALLDELPPPSFTVTKNVYCYASENKDSGWIYFDVPSIYIEGKGYQDNVISIRWPAPLFEDGFELTKEGYECTRRGIAQPKFDIDTTMTMWSAGKKWSPSESLLTIDEEVRKPLWEDLW
ncbi:MAG: hypothetical protein AAF702_26225 [Chloroflexota bacterium]